MTSFTLPPVCPGLVLLREGPLRFSPTAPDLHHLGQALSKHRLRWEAPTGWARWADTWPFLQM